MNSLFTAHHHLPSRTRAEVAPTVHGWALAFWRAVVTSQSHTATSLRATAGAKAKKIEAIFQKLSRAKWRQCIGASALEGKAAKPRRLAYH